MSRLGPFAVALFGLILVLPQSELAVEPDVVLTVDPDAPLTASDLGWDKLSFEFQLEDDEVAVMQRHVTSDGPYVSALLLRPNDGGSYSDGIGTGFNVSGQKAQDQHWVTQLSQSGVEATLEAQCGSFQCVWRLQKMKFSRAMELVPELESLETKTSFAYSNQGVILTKD